MLTRQQKRAQRRRVLGDDRPLTGRAAAWKTAFDAEPELSWKRGPFTVTVTDFAASGKTVHFWVRVATAAGTAVFEEDFAIVNPLPDHAGGTDGEGRSVPAVTVADRVRERVNLHLDKLAGRRRG